MKTATLLLAAIFLTSPPCRAQGWRTYSPPDNSFSVGLPAPLHKVMSFQGEHGASLEPDQKIIWASCYAAFEAPHSNWFGVITINGRARWLRSEKREDWLKYFAWVFLADDDELEFLKAPVAIKHNGLTGKEYLYIKESTHNSKLFTRGRIFDTGDKIYVIVFVGRDTDDLTSPDAERFLNSFRLQSQRRKAKIHNRIHAKHR
ncbi:MAG: hypothetical protein ACJ741_17105 [Pyrinomonadaceae bacterium]